MTIRMDSETRQMFESDFARKFGDDNPHWDTREANNELFLNAQANYLNNCLAVRGYLFLNDVYDALGFPRIPQGQLVGWFHADGRSFLLRQMRYDDDSTEIEFNVTHSDVMYFKI
jgi:hypothetical protein